MRAGTKRWRSVVVGALLAGVVGGGLLATQGSASPPKYYEVAGSPGTVGATPTAATITISNTTNNPITFAAANLDFAAGLTLSATSLSISQGDVALNGNRLELRNMNVGRRQSVTVSFQVSAAPSIDCSAYLVTSDVRQSNNFQGTDNRFTLQGADVSFGGPCGAVIECAVDGEPCTTGNIVSPTGNTANVTVNDGDGLAGTLTAFLITGGLTCPEYTPTSDLLVFDISITNTFNLEGVTKTVTFTQPAGANPRPLHEYQACFKAPYDFPALLPSQLMQDLNLDGWWGNTTLDTDGDRKGLLLPCDLTTGLDLKVTIGGLPMPAPCVSGRSMTATTVSMEITVPAADPGFRF